MHHLQEPSPLEDLRPDVPAGVHGIVRRLMAKRPEDRYQTPAELAVALGEAVPVVAAMPVQPTPVPILSPQPDDSADAPTSHDTFLAPRTDLLAGTTEVSLPTRPGQPPEPVQPSWLATAIIIGVVGGLFLLVLVLLLL
jgi:serine/threonine-protein kinase